MKLPLALAALAVSAGLAGCYGNFLPTALIDAHVRPGVGFSVDDKGVTHIVDPSVSFQARAGSLGATISGYSVHYFDSKNNEVISSDPSRGGAQSINVHVAAGLSCDDPGADGSCTFTSKNVRYAPGPESNGPSQSLLAADIALAYLKNAATTNGTEVNWHAEVTYTGVNDNGQPISWKETYPIVNPLQTK